jgi:hypothetical protein
MAAQNANPPSLHLILARFLESRGKMATRMAQHAVNLWWLKEDKDVSFRLDRTLQDLEVQLLLQIWIKCTSYTHETIVYSYEDMMMCALNQVPTGQVNRNSCNTIHAFCKCPSLPGMDEEAQKAFFRARALEKHNSKQNQYKVNQIPADDECSGSDQEDHEDYSATNNDMSNWTSKDWVDFQNVSFAPNPRPDFWYGEHSPVCV